MSIKWFLGLSKCVVMIFLCGNSAALAAIPPEGVEENISLVKGSTSNQLLIANDLKALVKSVENQRVHCQFKDASGPVEIKTYEGQLISCSRSYRRFTVEVQSLKIRVLKEKISLQSGKFANFPSFRDQSLNLLASFEAELVLVDRNLNLVADLFIEEFGKVQEQKVNSALAQAKLRGAYKGICTSLNLLSRADRDRVPFYLERAKSYGDVFLIRDRVQAMRGLIKVFQEKCSEVLDLEVYEQLSVLTDKHLKKFDSNKWVRESCQKLAKKVPQAQACPQEFKVDSYLINYLKIGVAGGK